MAYTLYAPQNVVIRTNDLDDLNILLQLRLRLLLPNFLYTRLCWKICKRWNTTR